MTNKEYVIQKHIEDLLSMVSVYGTCAFCETVGCKKYCKSGKSPSTCEETFKSWLKMEHNIVFEFGEICEVMCLPSITELWYYVGSDLCLSYFAKTKEEVEQINKCGITHYPKNNLKCFYFKDLEHFVKKVGD